MLKLMRKDDENDELLIVQDERGVKRQVYIEADDDVFILAGGPLRNRSYDDLDELDGIVPDLDRTLEDCQIALEQLQGKRERALHENRLALYLALEIREARLSGYVQALTFVRERLGNGASTLELPGEGDELVSLEDADEAQARLDGIVRRIETMLARRAEQQDLN